MDSAVCGKEAGGLEVVKVDETEADVPAPVEEQWEELAWFQQFLEETVTFSLGQDMDDLVE